ncbi:MAG: HD superfamily phosphohydrolase [Oleiphilaceae bacterium]
MNLNIEDLLGAHHKLIMDPIHGGIPLLTHEVLIVDHPLFQRLRFICQNDILSLVFPGATHSRFLHSIGTMHVGGRIFNTMIENSLKNRARQGISGVPSNTLEAISFFKRLVRCACLLHDSGHSSFSHQFNRTPTIKKILAQPRRFEKLWHGIDFSKIYTDIPTKLEHEHFSVRAAYQILSDIPQSALKIPIADILSLMDTTQVTPSSIFAQHAEDLWPLIHTDNTAQQPSPSGFAKKLQHLLASLVSGELDADRADYMLRDGFHSSVTIGGFNLDHLLSNLHFGWCPQTEWFGLAISHKGLGSLEDFVYSRHQMYRQVYAHKTAQGFDWLLRAAIDEVMTQDVILDFVTKGLSDIQSFKHLTDSYFWEAFRQYAETHIKSYSQCILERIKMPHLASRENLSTEEEQHYLVFLAKEHDLPKESLVSSSITARFTKIRDDYSGIKVLLTDHQSKNPSLRLISNTSQFFGKFTDERITHFYINPVPARVKE